MNWGKGIIAAFVLFALLVIALVGICMRQDVSLVSKNYYQEEIAYQEQLNRKNNTEALIEKPEITLLAGSLIIQFPATSSIEQGDVKLFRPSDARFDRSFQLNANEGVQKFAVETVKGAYRVKLSWRMGGKDFYMEKHLTVNG